MSKDIHEHLKNSAKFFSGEAVRNAIKANSGDTERWQLALLHIVTALEHGAKSALASVHPTFIRHSLDSDGKTVGIESAFARLADKSICGISLSENDRKRLRTAISLRNDIAHGSTGINEKALAAKFFEVYAFQREFLKFHLKTHVWDFLTIDERRGISEIIQSSGELIKRAKNALIEDDVVYMCLDCFEDFLVRRDDRFICLFCHWEEQLAFCDRCDTAVPQELQNKTSELFEYEWSEGVANFVQDYGVKEKSVCDDCFKEIELEVEQEKEAQMYDIWEQEKYESDYRIPF